MHKFLEEIKSAPGKDLVMGRAVVSMPVLIRVQNGQVDRVSQNFFSKYSVRVVGNKGMGIASSKNPAGLLEKATKSVKNMNPMSMSNQLSEEPISSGKSVTKASEPFDLDKAVSLLKHACEIMSEKRIVNKTALLSYTETQFWYADNTGSEFMEEKPLIRAVFCAVAKNENGIISSCKRMGRISGQEAVDLGLAEKAREEALELLQAGLLPSGKYPVLINPEVSGLLAHEAIGHACEADSVLAGESLLKNRLLQRIGSEHVTIVDDPTLPSEYGSYSADHEGVPASRTVLIEKGVLKSYLHSRESAGRMGTRSTGNARAESVDKVPLVRMSNTFFASGDRSEDELMEELGTGILLEGDKGGQVSTLNGEFQFAVTKAYEVRNGEKVKTYRDVMFSGNILKTLQNVTAAGKELGDFFAGVCGKGEQEVRVSAGGPSLLIKEVLLGGS